ncbi:Pentatricopeptide repeat [Trema orientale]|uniref:Pentatricopeptide repeat n=1 Tax=Trema orientale TaxID=63057 RepID=A0A2P5G017_TREOI|nr:Pentatricopeptide repeat [Trema orientale]
MLLRTPHGAQAQSPSNLCKFLIPFLFSSPLSSKPSSTSRAPNHLMKIPKPCSKTPISLSPSNHPQLQDTVSLSSVNSICSLLTNHSHKTSSIDDLLTSYKDKLNSNVVLHILMNYGQLGRIRTLEFFSWAGLQMGFQFDDSVIEYMADFLGRRKLFDDMKCLLLTVISHRGRVSCRTFSICIRYLGRQGRINEALCLFEEMGSKFRCTPDNLVYNNMLYVLCKKNSSEQLIDLAVTIFRRIELPDTYSYSNIVVGLCKFDRLETALDVLGEMGRAGLIPTRSAVNVLIGKFCSLSAKEGAIEKVRVNNTRRPFTILVPNLDVKSGAIQPAVQVFWAVHDLGMLPSSFVIVQLLSELCRLSKVDEAVKVLKVVEEMKPSCLDESYSIVMNAMCNRRSVEQASHLFGRMLSLGKKPKLSVYNSVICMLCKLGNLDDAERVYKIMNKNRSLPNNLTYSALIHAYVEAGNWEAGYDLLMEMLGLGFSPHFHTYDMVLKILSQAGKMDMCFKLERKLESQALQKLLKIGRLAEAYEKLKSMLDRGLRPPGYVRDAFKHAFEKHGKLKIAQELLDRVDQIQKSDE